MKAYIMKAYIVTQNTNAGKHFYAVLAESEDKAIEIVDHNFSLPCASYNVRPFDAETPIYVASVMNPRKEFNNA